MPKITILSKTTQQRTINIKSDSFTIGRDAKCDIVINKISVSREHCIIKKRGGDWIIFDSRSKHGTRIDGESISNRVLRNEEIINLGDVSIKFEALSEGEASQGMDKQAKESPNPAKQHKEPAIVQTIPSAPVNKPAVQIKNSDLETPTLIPEVMTGARASTFWDNFVPDANIFDNDNWRILKSKFILLEIAVSELPSSISTLRPSQLSYDHINIILNVLVPRAISCDVRIFWAAFDMQRASALIGFSIDIWNRESVNNHAIDLGRSKAFILYCAFLLANIQYLVTKDGMLIEKLNQTTKEHVTYCQKLSSSNANVMFRKIFGNTLSGVKPSGCGMMIAILTISICLLFCLILLK